MLWNFSPKTGVEFHTPAHPPQRGVLILPLNHNALTPKQRLGPQFESIEG